MIDRFTREQFEAALPKTVEVAHLGLQKGEYSYLLPVTGTPFGIMVRSSVDSTGVTRAVGKDSIRCWIVRVDGVWKGHPWGSKLSQYVTRVAGWQERMLHTLRELWKMCLAIERCPMCGEWMKVFRVKKEGLNKGRTFIKCVGKGEGCRRQFKYPKVA